MIPPKCHRGEKAEDYLKRLIPWEQAQLETTKSWTCHLEPPPKLSSHGQALLTLLARVTLGMPIVLGQRTVVGLLRLTGNRSRETARATLAELVALSALRQTTAAGGSRAAGYILTTSVLTGVSND